MKSVKKYEIKFHVSEDRSKEIETEAKKKGLANGQFARLVLYNFLDSNQGKS